MTTKNHWLRQILLAEWKEFRAKRIMSILLFKRTKNITRSLTLSLVAIIRAYLNLKARYQLKWPNADDLVLMANWFWVDDAMYTSVLGIVVFFFCVWRKHNKISKLNEKSTFWMKENVNFLFPLHFERKENQIVGANSYQDSVDQATRCPIHLVGFH